MSFKLVLIIAVVLITEVLTGDNSVYIPEKIKSQIPKEFVEVYKNTDNFAENVTLSVLSFYLKEKSSKAVECYKQNYPTYENFTKKFSQQITAVAKVYGQFFVKQYEKYAKKIQGSLNRMANFMATYPSKIWSSVNEGVLDKAAILIDEFKTRIKFNDILFTAEMKRFTAEKPEVAKKAKEVENRYKEIRQQAMKNSKVILGYIEKCMEGSKKIPNSSKGLEWSVIDIWSF